MKNTTKLIMGVICLGVGVLVAVLAFSGRTKMMPENLENPNRSGTQIEGAMEGGMPSNSSPARGTAGSVRETGVRRVVYTNAGFSPFLVEVIASQGIEFVNQSSGGLWVTTKRHPTAGDQGYEAFDSGRTLRQGETFVFSFTKVGTWGYKNLNNEEHLGAVVVRPQE